MAQAVVTPDQDAIISEIDVKAPAERVFQALTDPRQLKLWWNSDECQTEFFEMDPRPGGQWRFGTRKTKLNVNGVNQFFCQGEVLEFDPPRLLAYTWIANWHDDKSRTNDCALGVDADQRRHPRQSHPQRSGPGSGCPQGLQRRLAWGCGNAQEICRDEINRRPHGYD